MREENIDLNKMKRIGVITVANERLYSDDYEVLMQEDESPTKAFFKRMRQCLYKEDEDCILNMFNEENLILAHFDNNSIFLLSQNSVLSPRQFVNAMINLQNCSNEMRNIIERNSRSGCSEFGLENLNINFADIELSTGLPPNIAEHFILSHRQKFSLDGNAKGSRVGVSYSTGLGTITHKHVSQYGTNMLGFLNEMIKVNPDVRLLMSNIICQPRRLDLRKAMLDAIGDTFDPFNYSRDGKISEAAFRKLLESDEFTKNDRLMKEFNANKQAQINRRISNNKKYEVYPALKYVVETFGSKESMDENYLLEWYDGNSDTGSVAINYALNNMLTAARMENDSFMASPRVLPEVKKYMRTLDEKAYDINKKLEHKDETQRRDEK